MTLWNESFMVGRLILSRAVTFYPVRQKGGARKALFLKHLFGKKCYITETWPNKKVGFKPS